LKKSSKKGKTGPVISIIAAFCLSALRTDRMADKLNAQIKVSSQNVSQESHIHAYETVILAVRM
jgi:hypothetical protein